MAELTGPPHWDYALRLYMMPGVSEACLELQDRHGVDVNVLLLALFHRHNGGEVSDALLERMDAAGAEIRRLAVLPLRHIRRSIKEHPEAMARLGALRDKVKALEITAEREQQDCIAAVLRAETRQPAQSPEEVVRAVIGHYSERAPKNADLSMASDALVRVAEAARQIDGHGPD